jgi:GH18 family chitinase
MPQVLSILSSLILSLIIQNEETISHSYHRTKILTIIFLFRYLDFINIMAYDLHGSWESVTGHNAPLYAGPNDDGLTVVSRYNSSNNTTRSCTAYISEDILPHK